LKAKRTNPIDGIQSHGESLREAQSGDPDVKEILDLLGKSEERPPWNLISHQSPAAKSYWAQWERLKIEDGVLTRMYLSKDTSKTWKQVYLPRSLREETLRKLHDQSGHLGMEKVFDKVN